MQQAEREKLAAAHAATTLIQPGMAIGLGSGTTVDALIDVLGQSAPDASFVAASPATASAAAARSLHVVALDDVKELHLTIDGADQVDPHGWLTKGGGAAHTREKILARAARSFVVIVSSDKLVTKLRPPVPLEILGFAPETTLAEVGHARSRPDTPRSPDGGLIADYLGPVGDPRELTDRFDRLPGIIDHGLFPPEMIDAVIVGHGRRVEWIRPRRLCG